MTSKRENRRALGRIGLILAGLFLVLPPGMARAVVPPDSSFFSTVHIESAGSLSTVSDGDLWPSCWADDGHLYAANGDGRGFTMAEPRPDPVTDIAVSRIQGMPGRLTGMTLTTRISQIWQPGTYNRKPTGMVCSPTTTSCCASWCWRLRVATTPSNTRSDTANLALTIQGTQPIEKSVRFGNLAVLNNG